jgi:hypothetical protein
MSIDSKLYGVDLFGEPLRPTVTSPVSQKFLIPPFTVLNAREGDWQDRKQAWLAIGLEGETKGQMAQGNGRKGGLLGSSAMDGSWIKKLRGDDFTGLCANSSGTSIFDPVVCELSYRWFTADGWQIVDPFAGGSVRGIVASCLGRKYWGGELREEQVAANRTQAEGICAAPLPEWVCGDSTVTLDDAPTSDFVFSCPPYGDLEVYSDDPQDLSAMDWPAFLVAYRAIIAKACGKLKQDRFACFVVGDFRDKRGNYRNFVSETIRAFLDAGLELYNEAILVTSVGSACMRVTKQFSASRKFAKTHQNVLVFVKGDGKKAAQAIDRESPLPVANI